MEIEASEGFAKHVVEGDADGCCCEQIFSKKKGPWRHLYYGTLWV